MKTIDIRKRILQKKRKDRKYKKEASYDEPFEVRDAREHGFYITDDEYFNGMAAVCGLEALGVYNALCRHAGKDQTCYPSVDLMQRRLGISRGSVLKGLKELELHRVIGIDRAKGKPNIYTLLNKRGWRKFISVKTEARVKEGMLARACQGCVNAEGSPECDGCIGGSHLNQAGPRVKQKGFYEV